MDEISSSKLICDGFAGSGFLGEAVTAFVRLKKGHEVSEDTLIQFCKKKMASYKAPKKVVFVDDFPRTAQGKILKRKLKNYPK